MVMFDAVVIGIVAVLVTVKFIMLAVATFLFVTGKTLRSARQRGTSRPSPQRHPGRDAHA